MFSNALVVHSFKRHLPEYFSLLDLFALHSICGVGTMSAICVVRKDVDVLFIISVVCAPLACRFPPRC
jgi:hypothetical protein